MLLPYILVSLIIVRISVAYCIFLSLFSQFKMLPNDGLSNLETQDAAAGQARIDHYRVPKIPQFFIENPELWFV